MQSDVVSVAKAAELIGVTDRMVRKSIDRGTLHYDTSIGVLGGGNGGTAYRVYVDSLPVEAQIRYWQESAVAELGNGCQEFDLVGFSARHGEKGMAELLRRQRAALAAHGLRMRHEANGFRGYMPALALLARELGIAKNTLYRWERAYAEQGLSGLVRKEREDAGESRSMCLLARDYIEFLMCDSSKPPQSVVLERAQAVAAGLGECACENCPYRCTAEARVDAIAAGRELPQCDEAGQGMVVPLTRHAVNRAVQMIPNSVLAYARYGSRYWDAKYLQKVQRAKPGMVNEVWFGDHHQLDLFVLDRDGRLVRPWLTAWMDACSGALVGWMLTLNPNSDTIAESFARAVVATKGSPFRGLPRLVYIDNGKDYTSLRFEGGHYVEQNIGHMNTEFCGRSMLEVLGVEVKHALPYWAWSKPIERLFETLEGHFMRAFPGWCGGAPSERPQDLGRELKRLSERGELMLFETFAECFKRDVIDAYHNFRGEAGVTPLEIFAQAERARTDDPDWPTMALLKSQQTTRIVGTQGIKLHTTQYQDLALADMIGEAVTVLYNRGYNASVTIMHNNRFVCEAEPIETLAMVERDEEKLGRVMAEKRAQRRAVTGRIAAIGQHVRGIYREAYAEEIDAQRDQALARVGSLEGKRVQAGKAQVEKRRRVRKGELDAGERRVDEMLNARGREFLHRAKEG